MKQKHLHYVAVVHKQPRSDYGVSFPDFPGCITAGKTLDEAREMAQEALELHIEGMLEDGKKLPKATSMETVVQRATHRSSIRAYFVVSTENHPKQVVRINATLDPDLLQDIDHYARKLGMTRSGFIAFATKKQMEKGYNA